MKAWLRRYALDLLIASLVVIGEAAVAMGVGMIYLPVGVIVAGGALIGWGILIERGRR